MQILLPAKLDSKTAPRVIGLSCTIDITYTRKILMNGFYDPRCHVIRRKKINFVTCNFTYHASHSNGKINVPFGVAPHKLCLKDFFEKFDECS